MEYSEYQSIAERVRSIAEEEVQQVGGYWPVRVALAVVGEELAYATDELLADRPENVPEKLFSAFWILTCIANQYCCDLSAAAGKIWDDAAQNDGRNGLLESFVHYGRMQRTINRYEDGIYTDERPTEPVASTIVAIHRAILGTINFPGQQFEDLLSSRINEVRSFRGRPDIPHGPRFDPSSNESLDRFRCLASITACPFAATAKVWATEPWRSQHDVLLFVDSAEPTLRRFSRICQPEAFDGVVIECLGISSLESLKSATKRLLESLGRYSTPNPMAKPVARRDWRFTLLNIDVFLTVFSSIYPPDHPRFSMSANSTFYFFQPLTSFKAKHAKEKARIRDRFKDRGQDYTGVVKRVKYEAQKYIKPIDLGNGQLVEWWHDD